MKMNEESSCITQDNSNSILPKNNFLDCWLKGDSNIHFPRHLCNVIADINTASGQKLVVTTGGHLMISKKQEEDEQCSDLLQTVWSEYNIKGKEHLHAHVKNEKGKGYITDENFPLLFLIFCHFIFRVLWTQ